MLENIVDIKPENFMTGYFNLVVINRCELSDVMYILVLFAIITLKFMPLFCNSYFCANFFVIIESIY